MKQINQPSHMEKASDKKLQNLTSQDKHITLNSPVLPETRIQPHLHDRDKYRWDSIWEFECDHQSNYEVESKDTKET